VAVFLPTKGQEKTRKGVGAYSGVVLTTEKILTTEDTKNAETSSGVVFDR